MKKLFFIVLAFVVLGCGDKKESNMDKVKYRLEEYMREYAEYIQSFKIKDTVGLKITNIEEDIQGEPASLMFSGIRNGKLWLGIFNKGTKEQVYEWNDTEYLPQNRNKYSSNGIKQNIPIKFALIGGPVTKIEDTYIFIVYSGNNLVYTTPYTTDFYDLYFLKEDLATRYQGSEICTQIKIWYPGTILTQGYPWSCFTVAGEKLYSFLGVYIGDPISSEECIYASLSSVKRINLKTNTTAWETNPLYEDLSSKNPNFIYKESADDTKWTYKLAMMDGIKITETRTFIVDIETGIIEYK